MARKKKPTPKKPIIKIPPRQQNPTVAAIHESDEPLEFPESPTPSPNNGEKVGRLLEADCSPLNYDGSDRVDQPNLKLEEVQKSDNDGSILFTGGISSGHTFFLWTNLCEIA